MNSPGVTKREPITGAARFRGVLGVMRPVFFRGVVEPGFGDRLGSHWGLKGARPPRPVPTDFRRRKNLLGPLRWPRRPPTAPGRYSIYSTLRLALTLRPWAHALASLLAQTAARPVSYHDTLSAAEPRPSHTRVVTELRSREGARRFTERFLRESWAAFSLPSLIVLNVRQRDLFGQTSNADFGPRDLPFKIIAAARHAGVARAERAPHAPTAAAVFARLPGMSRSRSRPFGESVRGFRFLGERFFSSSLRRGEHTRVEIGVGSRTFVMRHSVHGLSETTLRTLLLRDVIGPALAGEPVARGLNYTPSLGAARPRLASAPAASRFTAIQLTLSMQKPDDADEPMETASRFIASPPMQYARPAAQLPRELAAGLRELRQSLRESSKTSPAPPAAAQIDHLTHQVYDRLKRELRIEKERRGL